jgi:hypothetical protein
MGEIFIFLFEHVGGAALVLILGFAADQISTPALKSYVVGLIKGRAQKKFRGENFYLPFLQGFIEPVFGRKTLSFSFFIRSCGMSIVFLLTALFLQFIFYGTESVNQFRIFFYSGFASFVVLVVLICFVFVIDYVSNAKSISLLRMAANSGRPSSVFLVFIADTTLTISIFTMIFPSALLISLFLTEPLLPPTQIKAAPVQTALRDLLAQDNPSPLPRYSNYKLHAFFLSRSKEESGLLTTSRPIVLMFAPASQAEKDVLADYASVLKTVPGFSLVGFDGDSITLDVKFGGLPRSAWAPLILAIDMETDVNRVAEVGARVWSLVPFMVPLSTLFGDLQRFYGPRLLTALCDSGEVRTTSSQNGAFPDVSCEPKLLLVTRAPDLNWKFRIASSASDGIPESPFFFSSFALANLYYASLFLFIAGAFLMRIVSNIFSTPFLEYETKPFTLLSLSLFPVIVLLSALLRVFW